MLSVDPAARPTARQLLQLPLFHPYVSAEEVAAACRGRHTDDDVDGETGLDRGYNSNSGSGDTMMADALPDGNLMSGGKSDPLRAMNFLGIP